MKEKSKIDWGYELDKWGKLVLIALCITGGVVYVVNYFHLVP